MPLEGWYFDARALVWQHFVAGLVVTTVTQEAAQRKGWTPEEWG